MNASAVPMLVVAAITYVAWGAFNPRPRLMSGSLSTKQRVINEYAPVFSYGAGVGLLLAVSAYAVSIPSLVPVGAGFFIGSVLSFSIRVQVALGAALRSEFEALQSQIEKSPLDPDLHAALASVAQDSPQHADPIYQVALRILADNPESTVAKQFAVSAGRISYSRGRRDRKPTVYDEQAIRNDIMARISHA